MWRSENAIRCCTPSCVEANLTVERRLSRDGTHRFALAISRRRSYVNRKAAIGDRAHLIRLYGPFPIPPRSSAAAVAVKFLGWTSAQGEDCGDFPVFEAKPLTRVFKEVPLAAGGGTVLAPFRPSISALHTRPV
jgi:hypothetical protein